MCFYLFDGGAVVVRAELERAPFVGDVVTADGTAYFVEAIAGQADFPVRDGEGWRNVPTTQLKVRRFDPFEALAGELPL